MANKEFTGVIITTPLCRLAFPSVFEKRKNLNDKLEYSVTMLFPKESTDMISLKNALVQAAKNKFGANVDLKALDMKRLRDGDIEPLNAREEFRGMWVVKAKNEKRQPGVVDGKLNKILDPAEIYSGVYAYVNITAKAYTLPNKGVTFYLNHVQKVKDGEPFTLAAQAKDVFDELNIPKDTADANGAKTEGMEELFS